MKKFVIPAPKLAQVPVKVSKMTPDRIRQEASKAALLASGGKRVSVNLPGPAAADLAAINARDGTDNTLSIIAALKSFAGR